MILYTVSAVVPFSQPFSNIVEILDDILAKPKEQPHL
mgnify:CR=1 FL=1